MIQGLLENTPKFYYINLQRSPERKELAEQQFIRYNVEYERINAIDGNEIEKWDERLSKFEYACTISHLEAIQTFYNSEQELGIICEDDISFEFLPLWKKSLHQVIQEAPVDCEILMLGYIAWPDDQQSTLIQEYNEFIPITHNSTLCYVITRKAAEKILKNHNPQTPNLETYLKIRPVADVLIYDLVKTYIYKYSLFTYPDNNTSTIHSSHSDFHTQSKSKSKEIYMS